jgi:hypothetical protein
VFGLIAIIVGLFFRSIYGPKVDDFNYRLKLTFDDNGHIIERSGVTRVIVRRGGCNTIDVCFKSTYSGEAIPVQFSNGSWIFALMGSIGPYSGSGFRFTGFVVEEILWDRRGPNEHEQKARPGMTFELGKGDLPGILFFSDLRDPRTANWVNPKDIGATIEPHASSKIRLLSATIEITPDPVTVGVQQILPWVSNMEMRDIADPKVPLRKDQVDPVFLDYMKE